MGRVKSQMHLGTLTVVTGQSPSATSTRNGLTLLAYNRLEESRPPSPALFRTNAVAPARGAARHWKTLYNTNLKHLRHFFLVQVTSDQFVSFNTEDAFLMDNIWRNKNTSSAFFCSLIPISYYPTKIAVHRLLSFV